MAWTWTCPITLGGVCSSKMTWGAESDCVNTNLTRMTTRGLRMANVWCSSKSATCETHPRLTSDCTWILSCRPASPSSLVLSRHPSFHLAAMRGLAILGPPSRLHYKLSNEGA